MSQSHPGLILGGASLDMDYKTPAQDKVLLGTANWLGIVEVDATTFWPILHWGVPEKLIAASDATSKGFLTNTKIIGNPGGTAPCLSPDRVRLQVARSRALLQLDSSQKINVLICEFPDYVTPIKDQASTLNELHEQGLFDKVGFPRSLDSATSCMCSQY